MFTKTLIIAALSTSTFAVGTVATPTNLTLSVGTVAIEFTEESGLTARIQERGEFSLKADLPILGKIEIQP